MPFTDILILAGIVAAFATFGLVLAWGEYEARKLVRADDDVAPRADSSRKKVA